MGTICNINVGVLGHVDSGKTALVAALSEILSTAALDKHPQSKERGITLDLGLSCFQVPCPEHLRGPAGADVLQFTLIDCPGHASLIRTVLVGAQVMDMMVLVVDASRGIQAQTAECIVIGELLTPHLVVALNKVDLLPEENRMKHMRRAGRNVLEALKLTRFADSEVVPVAAKVGGRPGMHEGLDQLRAALLRYAPLVARAVDKPFLFMADHCFQIKGQGTVLTGTVLQGQVATGDSVEVPSLKLQRKVKSIQCFKQSVNSVCAGDRAGICLTQLPASDIERTFVSAPRLLHACTACICAVEFCRFYAGKVSSRQKVHITIGHQTCMAQPFFFGLPDCEDFSTPASATSRVSKFCTEPDAPFDLGRDYLYQDNLFGMGGRPMVDFRGERRGSYHGPQWALLLFDKPVLVLPGNVLISPKLDMSYADSEPACRITFYGSIVHMFDAADDYKCLGLYRVKRKTGSVDRVECNGTVIVQGLFKKETEIGLFTGLNVQTGDGKQGVLEQPFGKSGKMKATFKEGLPEASSSNAVILEFKKYIFRDSKKISQ